MSINNWLGRIVVISVLAFAAPFSAGQTSDADLARWVGAWELNLARSSFGTEPPRSDTRRFSMQDGVLASEWNVVYAGGNTANVRYASRADGKDYPVTGSRSYDAVSMTAMGKNARAFEFMLKGKVVVTGYALMSVDGNSWVGVTERLDDKGARTSVSVLVFDKK